jgi:hypothetical protein
MDNSLTGKVFGCCVSPLVKVSRYVFLDNNGICIDIRSGYNSYGVPLLQTFGSIDKYLIDANLDEISDIRNNKIELLLND